MNLWLALGLTKISQKQKLCLCMTCSLERGTRGYLESRKTIAVSPGTWNAGVPLPDSLQTEKQSGPGTTLLLPDLCRVFRSGVLMGVISPGEGTLGKPEALSFQKLTDPASEKGPNLSVGKEF